MTVRRQFGSICAAIGNDDLVEIFAGNCTVHSFDSSSAARELILFWRMQHQAPASGAIIEALTWARDVLDEGELSA
jgi:hypothetical protein